MVLGIDLNIDKEDIRMLNDQLKQLEKKFGTPSTPAPVDNVAARVNNHEQPQTAQYGDMQQFQPVGGADILNIKNNIQALFNMSQGYKRLSPLKINDKYKHSVVSCLGAQGGLSSAVATAGLGITKELFDVTKKFSNSQKYGGYGAIVNDSLNDLAADGSGLVQGYNNSTADCYKMMQNFYPVNIK